MEYKIDGGEDKSADRIQMTKPKVAVVALYVAMLTERESIQKTGLHLDESAMV